MVGVDHLQCPTIEFVEYIKYGAVVNRLDASVRGEDQSQTRPPTYLGIV